MSSKSKSSKSGSKIAYVKGFVAPTEDSLQQALGAFPWDESREKTRETSLSDDFSSKRCAPFSMAQLNNVCYYSNVDKHGKHVWDDLPVPHDDGDWLANFVEAGQTFDEYVNFVTLRSGKFKPQTNIGKPIIYLLPITAKRGDVIQQWPSNGPDLQQLADWVRAFYDREVIILDPASVAVVDPCTTAIPGQRGKWKPAYEGECKIAFRTATYESYIEGRVSADGQHYQTHIDGLLSEITSIRTEGIHGYSVDAQLKHRSVQTASSSAPTSSNSNAGGGKYSSGVIDLTGDGDSDADGDGCFDVDKSAAGSHNRKRPYEMHSTPSPQATSSSKKAQKQDKQGEKGVIHDAFAVVGVTMEDLYSSEGDLFVAGMAAGGSKVAVLSFARYHPRIRMHFQNWWDYGYVSKSAEYSYFEENKKRPPTVLLPPTTLDAVSKANYLRRAGKLVVHELAHVYGIDHCVHYHCVMNGTGHLVEDFKSPAFLCAVCLRKVQFRMGFDVPQRYRNLLDVFKAGGMEKETKWVQKRLEAIA